MTLKRIISGWGGYPKQEAKLLTPFSYSSLQCDIKTKQSLISRGMGRSYGDSANSTFVLQTKYFDHFITFDPDNGLLRAEAGITLRDILKVILPQGWFLPVTPGTSYVTLGGAIAGDVHGKNHHISGTFGQHVKSMDVLLGTGDLVAASPKENVDLFHATCGGMGLTGVILNATIQLIPIQSSYINQKTIKADNIDSALEAFEVHSSSPYSVAWIDCLTRGKNLGRSVLMLGEHENNGSLSVNFKKPFSIPMHTPAAFLNHLTVKTFNSYYWGRAKHNKVKRWD